MYMWLAKGVYMQVSFAAVHMVTGFFFKKPSYFESPFMPSSLSWVLFIMSALVETTIQIKPKEK